MKHNAFPYWTDKNFIISVHIELSSEQVIFLVFNLDSPKTSPVSCHQPASSRCGNAFCFFGHLFLGPAGKYVIHCIHGDQISHIQSMVAKRGLTNQANVHTPV